MRRFRAKVIASTVAAVLMALGGILAAPFAGCKLPGAGALCGMHVTNEPGDAPGFWHGDGDWVVPVTVVSGTDRLDINLGYRKYRGPKARSTVDAPNAKATIRSPSMRATMGPPAP